jgi:hypothetical protein
MRIPTFVDPVTLPGTDLDPAAALIQAIPLGGPALAYLTRRAVPLEIAQRAGLSFHPDFGGRPALVVPLRDAHEQVVAVHGRYLETRPGQNKMLTIGIGGGLINVGGGWRSDPLILVEGLFDALSLSVCGLAAAATIGRWAPWLPEAVAG